MRRYAWGTVVALAAALCLCCSGGATTTPTPIPPTPTPTPTPDPVPVGPTEVFVGAGDIANCDNDAGRPSEATAKLLDGITGTVFAAGDIAYPYSSTERLTNCYQPRWGRHKSRTRTAIGNHEYETPSVGPKPYFDYFGAAAAGPPGLGFYSFTLGTWHIVSLNSNGEVPSGVGTEQWTWLRDDLTATNAKCVLAFWHHPTFSSGPSGGGFMREAWSLLAQFKADVIVNGHDHFYERFRPQDVSGRDDPNGIRQFTVGTGGAVLYRFVSIRPNSEVRIATYGVLKLTLRPGAYDWEFIEAGSGASLDTGSEACR